MNRVINTPKRNLAAVSLALVVVPLAMLTNEKLTFSAGLSDKIGEYCYVVQGKLPNNDVYRGNRLLPGRSNSTVEVWKTASFEEECDPKDKIAHQQYNVESSFNPFNQKLSFRVYKNGNFEHEEVWDISSRVKEDSHVPADSKTELSLNVFTLPLL